VCYSGVTLFVVDSLSRDRVGRMRRLRESFEEWHRLGIAASQRGDLASLADAIHAEADLMREQERVMDELRGRVRSQSL